MSVPILGKFEPVGMEMPVDPSGLRSSLKEFVEQFAWLGSQLVWWDRQAGPVQQVSYWAESAGPDPLPWQAGAIAWPLLEAALPLQMVELETSTLPTPWVLYGCRWQDTAACRGYLLCWNRTPLSDHQRYGLSLYAQSLARSPQPPLLHRQMLDTVLQRTRHQLRTPLALILLHADLLKTTVMDGRSQAWLEDLRETAMAMHVSLEHLTEVDSLLDPDLFDPQREPNVGHYDLRHLWAQCCQALQPWIVEKQLELVYDAQPLWLWVNGWKIQQVLQNILSNAIAFSPVQGVIAAEWQSFQTEVLIQIADQGPGLSETDLRSLGTPFYSRRPGGTGLGLAIAKQLILEHQGSLWGQNLPTGGAQFCIMLPRRQDAPKSG